MDEEAKREELLKSLVEVEFQPSISVETEKEKYDKISLAEIASFGAAFAMIPNALQSMAGTGGEGVYRVVFPKGVSGTMAMKDGDFLGAIFNDGKIVGQARLQQVSGLESVGAQLMPFSPLILAAAAVMVRIDNKLTAIQQTADDILQYLEMDKRAKVQGSIHALTDILNNYKYNWDNAKYIEPKHSEVQRILTQAESELVFSKERIETMIRTKKHKADQMKKEFRDYQMALYLFGFAKFLDVLLMQNFSEDYLRRVTEKMGEYTYQYRELYTQCYNLAEQQARGSIGTVLMRGAAQANKFVGETIAKIPVISRSQVDENLIAVGERLGKRSAEQVDDTMDQLRMTRDSGIQIFIDYIEMIGQLYNQPMECLLDQDALYIKQ